MKLHFFQTVLIGLLAWATTSAVPVPAAASITPPSLNTTSPLATSIAALINKPQYAAAQWGIEVVSLDSGQVLYSHRAHQLMQPASTAKLYTAALILDEFNSDYRIPTQVLARQPIRWGRLSGPLVLYGMGDPSLGAAAQTSTWADQLAKQLAAQGLHVVDGDLIADDTYFSGPAFGAGWEVSDLLGWFAASSSALTTNENILGVRLQPAKVAGRPAQISFIPASFSAKLKGTIETGPPGSPNNVNFYRAPGAQTLFAFGSLPAGSPAQNFRFALANPAYQAGRQLMAALKRQGIRIKGRLRIRHWPASSTLRLDQAYLLAQVWSPTLNELLKRGLKHSQNLYLENLLQLAGVKAQATPFPDEKLPKSFLSSAQWGLYGINHLLKKISLPPTAVQLSEGTGLSRRDLSSPYALTRLLSYLAGRPYAQMFRDDLPIGHVDGTLKHRMPNLPPTADVRAKTGSMSFVHCLAGYLTTAAGEHLAFAIMLNNYAPAPHAPSSANQDIDAIVYALANLTAHS